MKLNHLRPRYVHWTLLFGSPLGASVLQVIGGTAGLVSSVGSDASWEQSASQKLMLLKEGMGSSRLVQKTGLFECTQYGPTRG